MQQKEGEEVAGAGEQLQLEVADLTTKEKIELKNLHFFVGTMRYDSCS